MARNSLASITTAAFVKKSRGFHEVGHCDISSTEWVNVTFSCTYDCALNNFEIDLYMSSNY